MDKSKILLISFFALSFLVNQLLAQSEDSSTINDNSEPIIKIISLDVNEQSLEIRYEIRNESDNNIWILSGLGKYNPVADAFIDQNGKTILIRRSLNVPTYRSIHNLYGRYVLMKAGQSRLESISLNLPFYPHYLFGSGQQARNPGYATCLAIEIGYYSGNLSEMIYDILNKIDNKTKNSNEDSIRNYFKSSLHFNIENEILNQRDEEILVPYTDRKLKGEQILRANVKELHIPYKDEPVFLYISETINIPKCERIQIHFEASILEYFFPCESQQNLLSSEERKSLMSMKEIISDDKEAVKIFIDTINKASPTFGIICRTRETRLACYKGDEHLASFSIFNGDSIVTDGRGHFVCDKGETGLINLLPQIKPFDLRIKCAANIKNLWYRLRSSVKEIKPISDSSGKISYPPPNDWCDTIVRIYQTIDISKDDIIKPFICPSVEENKHLAKSYYAMNPNCEPNSPGDMVLLFETKAGWNQHGGPDLFTFDNHNPKGGCVLLNDGTVKFIRTEEELNSLRWK